MNLSKQDFVNAVELEILLDNLVDEACKGIKNEVTIYWDTQNPNDAGPAFRIKDGPSGTLEFIAWFIPRGQSSDGYLLDCFFKQNGEYSGPDAYGVYPIFIK